MKNSTPKKLDRRHIVAQANGLPRIDSRIVARQVGLEHRALKQRIRLRQKSDLEFAPIMASGGDTSRVTSGRSRKALETYYLLSFTDLAYLLPRSKSTPDSERAWRSFSTNAESAMVNATRHAIALTTERQLALAARSIQTDAVHDLHQYAISEGSTQPEHLRQTNVSRLVHKALGIPASAKMAEQAPAIHMEAARLYLRIDRHIRDHLSWGAPYTAVYAFLKRVLLPARSTLDLSLLGALPSRRLAA